MRTVLVHLKDASKRAVIDWLDSFAVSQGDSNFPWLYPSANDPVLYIELSDTFELHEPEEMKRVINRLDQKPSITISANVSGRHDGTADCRYLVSGLLSKFEGVATDGFSDHFWTLADVERGKASDGTPFFDFHGTYHSLQ